MRPDQHNKERTWTMEQKLRRVVEINTAAEEITRPLSDSRRAVGDEFRMQHVQPALEMLKYR